ncbi:MAG: site-2 protease family protein [Vicinamibacteria bacterium]|nr:site-2 protease family protein [Vicinamibacteria bacterium]
MSGDVVIQGLIFFVVLLFSLSAHESAHAWAAHRMGDDTAMRLGRVSLNPIRHIDPMGTVVIPLLMIFVNGLPLFGWAKPTPVVPSNFRQQARGHVLVSAAGPASNLVLAIVASALYALMSRLGLYGDLFVPIFAVLKAGVILNVVLMIFNLIPLPPLDGSWIVSWGLPRSFSERYDRVIAPYGMWILILLVFSGAIGFVLGPVVRLVHQLLLLIA